MRKFKNPANDTVYQISDAWLWSLLFGPFYYVAHGAWATAVIYLGAAIVLAPTIIGVVIVWLVGAALAEQMIANSYLRKGWIEVMKTTGSPAAPTTVQPKPNPSSHPPLPSARQPIRFNDARLQNACDHAIARHDEMMTSDSHEGRLYRQGFEHPEDTGILPSRGSILYAAWAAGHNRSIEDQKDKQDEQDAAEVRRDSDTVKVTAVVLGSVIVIFLIFIVVISVTTTFQ